MMMVNSEHLPAETGSHPASLSSIQDHPDALAPLPTLHNLEFTNLKSDTEARQVSVLPDGRLDAIDNQLPQEVATGIIAHAQVAPVSTPPAKQRAPPPPPLSLAIPKYASLQSEWHIASRSAGLPYSASAATHNPSEHLGVSAGYFSPPHSPDASSATPVSASQSTVSLPSPSSTKKTRSRSRSVVSGGKYRGLQKMVKERRSLQTIISSFLQPQTTPIGLLPGPRVPASPVPSQGVASGANNSLGVSSGAAGNGNEGSRSERRRSFYGRRRSSTFVGGNNSATGSTSAPPMPAAPGGRESPSAYLLDDDPFAPAPIPPPVNSPTHSVLSTPLQSPTYSLPHSRTSSTVSFSSASSSSMPGTPVLSSFGTELETRERDGPSSTVEVSNVSAASTSTLTIPTAPPPPPSPLNPNSSPTSPSNEAPKPRDRMLRSLSASLLTSIAPSTAAQSPSPSPSPSPLSPTHTPSVVSPLPHPSPSRARPAHTRPAFSARPSLPSLKSLSRMSTTAGGLASSFRGKRSGRVGAGLPAEPWDLPTPEPESGYGIEEEVGKLQEVEEQQLDGEMEILNSSIASKVAEEKEEKEAVDSERVIETGRISGDSTSEETPVLLGHTSTSDATTRAELIHRIDEAPAIETYDDADASTLQPSVSEEAVHTSSEHTLHINISEADGGTTQIARPSFEDQGERRENDEAEDNDVNIISVAVAADGEGVASINAVLKQSASPSGPVNDANGEIPLATTTFTTRSGDALDSEAKKVHIDDIQEPCADQETGSLNGGDGPLKPSRPADDSIDGENITRLSAAEPSSPLAHCTNAITIPGRASAIPRHVLRALTPYPFTAPRCVSPTFSVASLSPESSVEDFGISLSSSPGFRGDQRPESLAIDPALPDALAHTHVRADSPVLPREQDQPYLTNAASLSSASELLPPLFPSLISHSGGEPEIETEVETGPDSDLGNFGDLAFAQEIEARAECRDTFATSIDLSSPSRVSLASSPSAATSEQESPEPPPPSPNPIGADDLHVQYTSSSEDLSLPPSHEEDYSEFYIDDYDYEHQGEHGYAAEEEDDSSMLPPLSTLPEEDPVFRLTPAHSRERYGGTDYSSLSSRSMSRKASVATFTSIFSMRSGSSGNVSHISHSFSRAHSPSVSLSTTLPYSNSQPGSNSGSLIGRRAHGSNAGSVDSGRGPVPSSSVSSLQSKSSMDLRALANARSRQGSQSSGLSLQSRSSTRTKFEPHVQAQARKSPSAEEVSLGLRAYTGNPYAVAVQAELEGKASKYESPSKAKFDDEELVLDISQDAVAPTIESEPEVTGWKTYDSVLEAAGLFEPGTSAGTVRPSTQPTEVEIDTTPSLSVDTEIGADDSSTLNTVRTHTNGYGYSSGRGGSGRDWDGAGAGAGAGAGGYTGYSSGFGGRYGSSGSDESGGRRGGLNTGRRGRDNSRGGDGERQNRKLPVSAPSSSEEESESESETSSDDYGEETGIVHRPAAPQIPSVRAPSAASNSQEEPVSPIFSQLRNGRKGVFRPPTITTAADTSEQRRPPTAEDDDVPLAQRIPGALHAQQTIRQQVRSERDRRRRDRSVAPTPRTSRAPEGTISPPPQHVPAVNQDERGRSLTARLPRTAPLGAAAATLSSSQEAAIIAQRMTQPQHVQQAARRQRAKTLSGADAGVPPEDLMKRLLKVQARDTDAPLPLQRISGSAATHLQQQSSHVRDTAPAEAMSRRKPVPAQDIMLPTAHQTLPNTPGPSAPPAHTLRPMRSLHNLTPVAGAATTSAPMASATVARRPTSSRGRPSQEANTVPDGLMRNKSLRGTRPSIDKTNAEEAEALRSPHPRVQSHHVPPVPAVSRGPSPPARSHRHVVQMRVYIGDMQRFNVVEAGLETSARDVLDMLKQQGDLRGEDRRLNNWMLYEMCHDFGMERPVRSFELVTDISGSWNKEKTMNCFMVKQSPFAHSLATIPSSIPTRSGFVDYESKKGKWNKRWLELREHGLWVSKREGKDDEFLCSLSAFDAYIVTRIHKATKSFTFAVKSTDPITLFENKADYLHVFSVPEDTGMAWVEAIWLARSYILYQEKNVLFRNKMSSEGTSSTLSSSGGVARSGTRKKPVQTYVTLAQPKVPGVTDVNGPFEPGSLLARRAAT